MSRTLIFGLLVLTFCVCFIHSQSNVTLITKKGPIIGRRFNPSPATGVSYDAFIGIPYGEVLARFQPAVAHSNWSSAILTQSDGPVCPQPDVSSFSEDCLYLNVYTPMNASLTPGTYPVIAFIHGSGFTWTSSSSLVYGPDFLVQAGVILVTMNYRLGATGFLTLGSKVAPGNLGIYDTLLSLQWIQNEISVFGGDPTQVTLMGHSAGSVMTHFHYLSPVSSGLFKRMIAQSGPGLTPVAHITAAEGVRRAKLLAKAVNCDTTLNDTALLDCLQKVNINYIVGNQSIELPTEVVAIGNGIPFLPVLDTSFLEKPFFNDTINNLMKQAVTRAKPILMGFASEDGIIKFSNDEAWRLAEANLKAFLPESASRSLSDDKKTALTDSIRSRYFSQTPDENKVLDLVRLYTDFAFAYPTIETAQFFANWTYSYIFAYDGSWATLPPFFTRFKVMGVSHGAELSYLFYSANSKQDLNSCPSNRPNLDMSKYLVKLWTTFAKTGVPDSLWKPVGTAGYLVIDSAPSMRNNSMIESQYYNFWDDLNHVQSSASSAHLNFVALLIALWFVASMSSLA